MTNAELLQWVYLKTGSEKDSRILEPVVIAVANLVYPELARFLIDHDPEMAKKLITILSNQTWVSNRIAVPTDMILHKQKDTTRLTISGTLAYQVDDRDKLDLMSGLDNIYYALEGTYFYIKHTNVLTVGGSNLGLSYYRIPTVTDIDDDLRPIFLDLLINRLVPKPPKVNDSNK
jgi:hypothetical protein